LGRIFEFDCDNCGYQAEVAGGGDEQVLYKGW